MEVGAAVWVRDSGPETWVSGVVSKKELASETSHDLEIELDRGGKAKTRVAAGETEAADVKLRNSANVSVVEDLITLPHLHEPAILHSLSERFNQGEIYTWTGPILIAVNPFKRLPLYTEDRLMTYFEYGMMVSQGLKTAGTLPPHVFAVADAAYRAMMESIRNKPSQGNGSQSILISGESGAGKTESTKFTMKYLTTVGSPNGMAGDAPDSIMRKVLQSNPILEAFGNARTIRNDNSSRFGKFIEMWFDKRGHLIGASIETYLLEKVRLPNQAANERNFHIFYQLCASEAQRSELRLGDVTEYHYVNQGDCYKLRQVDDKDEFASTLQAMKVLGFGEDNSRAVLRLVAGLLHLGQVAFRSDGGEGSEAAPDERNARALLNFAELCSVQREYLLTVLTTRVVETRNEQFTVKLRPEQAMDARDALAKGLYGRMFNWIVARINAGIATDLRESRASVAVLDIFGFECFLNNSFEQLCINYTNETLQQQFNLFVFKMEQAEYEREKIEWSFISFPDNQDALDLIEGKPTGILAMLDDECRLPKGSDEKLSSRLQKDLGSHARFFVTKKMVAERHFGVRHYAGEVAYNTAGFLEKNKDQLPKEATNLFLSSDAGFMQGLFADAAGVKGRGGGGGATTSPGKGVVQGSGAASASVATQFKQQLHELMAKIQTTRPHYIRTIKPNDEAAPDRFTRLRVNEQLRYGGVLEAVRVARSGYPVRLPHADFFARYRCLATAAIKGGVVVVEEAKRKSAKAQPLPRAIEGTNHEADRQWCERVLEGIMALQEAAGAAVEAYKVLPRDSVQLGKTKVFLRKVAYEVLEFKRISRLAEAATKITTLFRGAALRREYMILRAATRYLQRVVRGHMGRKVATARRRERAALRMQTAYRAFHDRNRWVRFRGAVLRLQCRFRGRKARRLAYALACGRAAGRLQAWGRGALAARRYRRFQRAVVAMQCGLRVRVAKRQLRELRVEARSIGNLQKNNEQLKEELTLLKEMLVKKAADERAEKERQLEGERRAAAAAALEELEQWKLRFAEVERRLGEETALRKEVQARAEELQGQAAEKDRLLAEERHARATAMEKAHRVESDLELLSKSLQAEVARRKQAEADLANAPPPPASPRPSHTRVPSEVSDTGRPARTGHRILDAVASPRGTGHRKSFDSLELSGSKEPSTPQPPSPVHSRSSSSLSGLPQGSRSPPSTAAGEVTTAAPTPTAPAPAEHEPHRPASSSTAELPPPSPTPDTPEQEGEEVSLALPPLPPSSTRRPPLTPQPPTPTPPQRGLGESLRALGGSAQRRLSATRQRSAGEEGRDELDKSVDLMDDEQQLRVPAQQLARRQLLDRMPGKAGAFRRDMSDQGLQVDVVELTRDGKHLAWVRARMRMLNVRGRAEELLFAQVVWETDKPKGGGGFLGGLLGGRPAAKQPEPPKTLPMAMFYAINRGVRRVRLPYEVEAGDVSRVATITTRPEPEKPSRAVVVRFDTAEQRDEFVDGLRRFWGEVQDGLVTREPPPMPPALEDAAMSVKGYEGGQVVPYEEAARVMLSVLVAARREARALYGEVLDLSMDVYGMERECQRSGLQLKQLLAETEGKRKELGELKEKCRELHHDRVSLLKRVEDLTMDVRDKEESAAKIVEAQMNQFDEEVRHLKHQLQEAERLLDEQKKANEELLRKNVSTQERSARLTDEFEAQGRVVVELNLQNQAMRKQLSDLKVKVLVPESPGGSAPVPPSTPSATLFHWPGSPKK